MRGGDGPCFRDTSSSGNGGFVGARRSLTNLPDRTHRRRFQLCASLDPHTRVFFASGTVEPGFKKWEPLGAATFEMALVGMDRVDAFLLLATAAG